MGTLTKAFVQEYGASKLSFGIPVSSFPVSVLAMNKRCLVVFAHARNTKDRNHIFFDLACWVWGCLSTNALIHNTNVHVGQSPTRLRIVSLLEKNGHAFWQEPIASWNRFGSGGDCELGTVRSYARGFEIENGPHRAKPLNQTQLEAPTKDSSTDDTLFHELLRGVFSCASPQHSVNFLVAHSPLFGTSF